MFEGSPVTALEPTCQPGHAECSLMQTVHRRDEVEEALKRLFDIFFLCIIELHPLQRMESVEEAQCINVVDAIDVQIMQSDELLHLMDNVAISGDSLVGGLMSEKVAKNGVFVDVIEVGDVGCEDNAPSQCPDLEVENRILHDAMHGLDMMLSEKIETEELVPHFNVHEDVMNYHPNTCRLVCYNLVAKRITG